MPGLIVYLLFPFLCTLAIPPAGSRYRGALAERVICGIALYESLALATGLALGLANQLTTGTYLLVMSVTATLLGMISWRNGLGIAGAPLRKWAATRRGRAAVVLALLIAMVYAFQLGIDARYGTKHYDGLWYHIPRIIFWLQQGNFAAWQTPVWAQIALPVGADIILGQKIFLGNGWLGSGYVSLILSIGAIACVYCAALDFGFSRWHAVMSALLFASFPALGLRIWSLNSDIAAAFPVLAAYVLLHRMRTFDRGIAMFIALSGIAIACKQTMVFQVALLAGIILWQDRDKIRRLRSWTLPAVACIIAASFMVCSFLPIHTAFGDLEGGDGGRAHKVTSPAGFAHAVGMSASHWLLEPLGYLAPIPQLESGVKSIARNTYNLVGAHFDVLPEKWRPWPAQDIGRSGLVPLLLLPLVLFGLPPKARAPCALIFLAGFIPLSGTLSSQPWFARYTIVVLAGYALVWGGTTYVQRGRGRRVLIALAAVNILALAGVVMMRSSVDINVKSKPGGPYYFIADSDRRMLAESLHGRPLQVITDGSLDSLLVGPDISFRLTYLMFPKGSGIDQELKKASRVSNWIAIVHEDDRTMLAGTEWHRPNTDYRHNIPFTELETALHNSGWQRYTQNSLVDLWKAL